MGVDWTGRDPSAEQPGFGAVDHSSANQAAYQNWVARNPRNDSDLSSTSVFDAMEQCPVAAWVESHAAVAWQQAPPEGDPAALNSASSMEAAMEVPAEAAQLSQVPPDLNHPAGEESPLEGHPRYKAVQDLYKGAQSWVQLALDMHTGQQVAVKFLRRDSLDVHPVTREVVNQRACARHPHIVQLHEVFMLPSHLAIVMSYCNGGDLATLLGDRLDRGRKGLGEPEARFCFQQLIMALDYCHCLGISMRDIKVDNVLLHWVPGAQRPILKLCDFGFSREQTRTEPCASACGTPEYMAPEVLYGAEYCGQTADIWAAGVSLYVLLTGGFPFSRPSDANETAEKSMQAVFLRIVAGRYSPVPHLSQEAQHLLHVMLRPSPGDRIDIDSILQHPWFVRDLPPQLRAVNANLICSTDGAQFDASFEDPCRQSEEELAELIQQAALGGGARPADLFAGRREPQQEHSQQERALAQDQQREHELHRLQQAAEIERQIELEQLRLSAQEAGTQPQQQQQQSQPQRYDHGHLQERRLYHQHRGDVAGAPRPRAQQLHHLTDTLQRFSFSDNVARAPEQPLRREVVAQPASPPFGQFAAQQDSGQPLTREALRQQEDARSAQLRHLQSHPLTTEQLHFLEHQRRQKAQGASQQQEQPQLPQSYGAAPAEFAFHAASPAGQAPTMYPAPAYRGQQGGTSGGVPVSAAGDASPQSNLGTELRRTGPSSSATPASFEFDTFARTSGRPSTLADNHSWENRSFEFDQCGRANEHYHGSDSNQSCHMH